MDDQGLDDEKPKQEIKLFTAEDDDDAISIGGDEKETDFSDPSFILQNLKIANDDCFRDSTLMMTARRTVVETICHQITFYCYCALQPFLKRSSKPVILICGCGFVGARVINCLIGYGLRAYLYIYTRGEVAVSQWESMGLKLNTNISHLLQSRRPDIIIMCTELSGFPSINKLLVSYVSPATCFITATVGLQRRRIFSNMSPGCVFRTFQEPQKVIDKIKADNVKNTKHADDVNDEPVSERKMADMDDDDFDDDNRVVGDAGIFHATKKTQLSRDRGNSDADASVQSLQSIHSMDEDDANEDLSPEANSAELIASRTSDIRHLIFVLENYYAMQGTPHLEARHLAMVCIIGFEKDSSAVDGISTIALPATTTFATGHDTPGAASSRLPTTRGHTPISGAVTERASSPTPTTTAVDADSSDKPNISQIPSAAQQAVDAATMVTALAERIMAQRLQEAARCDPALERAVKAMSPIATTFQRRFSRYIRVMDIPHLLNVVKEIKAKAGIAAPAKQGRRASLKVTQSPFAGPANLSAPQMGAAPAVGSGVVPASVGDTAAGAAKQGDRDRPERASSPDGPNAGVINPSAAPHHQGAKGNGRGSMQGGVAYRRERKEEAPLVPMHTDEELFHIYDMDMRPSPFNNLSEKALALLSEIADEDDDEFEDVNLDSFFDGVINVAPKNELILHGDLNAGEGVLGFSQRKKGVTFSVANAKPIMIGAEKHVGKDFINVGVVMDGNIGILSVLEERAREARERTDADDGSVGNASTASRSGANAGGENPSRAGTSSSTSRAKSAAGDTSIRRSQSRGGEVVRGRASAASSVERKDDVSKAEAVKLSIEGAPLTSPRPSR